MREEFGKFVEFKALVLKLALDSTPMRMSEATGAARSMDAHARFLEARAASGERMSFSPELVSSQYTEAGLLLLEVRLNI